MEVKLFILSAILLYSSLSSPAATEPVEDKRALLDFSGGIFHSRRLNWNGSTSACSSWTGITCNRENSRVLALRLPGIGLKGAIPPNTLSRLSDLQILSLRSNGLNGSFPSDLLQLTNLVGLHLQGNDFAGPLPSDLSAWKNLTVLDLSENGFDGSIPPSVANLTHLTVLNLSNNSFSGEVPDVGVPSLQFIDLSNNNLTGVLPRSLSRFPASSFSGNNVSFAEFAPPPPAPQPQTTKRPSKFGESAILGIVIGSCVVAFVSIAFLLVLTNRKEKEDDDASTAVEKKEKPVKKASSEDNKLVFFEGSNLAFDLEDLLRASAEVLGKGTFGTTYKAALEDATIVAVKRLKEVIVGRKEFEVQMEIVGSIRHENVTPLRAYYYSKDEKLVVYDYNNQGSVSALLHGTIFVPE